jgi:hypothetical protein
MSASDPITPERRSFVIRLPRPLWIGVTAMVLIVVSMGVGFVIPIWRQQVAIREIRRLGGRIEINNGGPQWLRKRVTDAGVAELQRALPGLMISR